MTRTALFLLPLAALLGCAETDDNQDGRDGMVEQQDPGNTPGDSSNDPADDDADNYDTGPYTNDSICWGHMMSITVSGALAETAHANNGVHIMFDNDYYAPEYNTDTGEYVISFEFYEDDGYGNPHGTDFWIALDEPDGTYVATQETIMRDLEIESSAPAVIGLRPIGEDDADVDMDCY